MTEENEIIMTAIEKKRKTITRHLKNETITTQFKIETITAKSFWKLLRSNSTLSGIMYLKSN